MDEDTVKVYEVKDRKGLVEEGIKEIGIERVEEMNGSIKEGPKKVQS